ncbi:hypothetical protein [Bradyrhizobium sp. 33ap4]|uniref:hypothetical protein n=1 Tax=Bradyrhizobium sp. 33ap4 TaxID=3061630 RepID=UPI00292DA51C|nr:hypothetical protein [Bradyrhizobium sp. 33ap4]
MLEVKLTRVLLYTAVAIVTVVLYTAPDRATFVILGIICAALLALIIQAWRDDYDGEWHPVKTVPWKSVTLIDGSTARGGSVLFRRREKGAWQYRRPDGVEPLTDYWSW